MAVVYGNEKTDSLCVAVVAHAIANPHAVYCEHSPVVEESHKMKTWSAVVGTFSYRALFLVFANSPLESALPVATQIHVVFNWNSLICGVYGIGTSYYIEFGAVNTRIGDLS